MKGPQLLQALMDARGDNANAIAERLKQKSIQSTIWKFIKGVAKEPRRKSLQPLADHYGVPVEAFYDETLAEQIATERGMASGASVSEPRLAPTSATPPEPDALLQSLQIVAAAIAASDQLTRLSIEPLLSRLALEPSEAGTIAQRLHDLLAAQPTRPAGSHDGSPESQRIQLGITLDDLEGKNGQRNRDAPQKRAKK